MDFTRNYTPDSFIECLDLELNDLRNNLSSAQGTVSQDTFIDFVRSGYPFFTFAKLTNGYTLTFTQDSLNVQLLAQGGANSIFIDYTPIGFDCCVSVSFNGRPVFYRGNSFQSFRGIIDFLLARDGVVAKYNNVSFLSDVREDLHELSKYCLANNVPVAIAEDGVVRDSLIDTIYLRNEGTNLFVVDSKSFGFLSKSYGNADYVKATCLMDLGDIYI